MSRYIPRSSLDECIKRINKVHHTMLRIDWAYNKPRIESATGRQISSRFTTNAECMEWLYGFEAGMDEVKGPQS